MVKMKVMIREWLFHHTLLAGCEFSWLAGIAILTLKVLYGRPLRYASVSSSMTPIRWLVILLWSMICRKDSRMLPPSHQHKDLFWQIIIPLAAG